MLIRTLFLYLLSTIGALAAIPNLPSVIPNYETKKCTRSEYLGQHTVFPFGPSARASRGLAQQLLETLHRKGDFDVVWSNEVIPCHTVSGIFRITIIFTQPNVFGVGRHLQFGIMAGHSKYGETFRQAMLGLPKLAGHSHFSHVFLVLMPQETVDMNRRVTPVEERDAIVFLRTGFMSWQQIAPLIDRELCETFKERWNKEVCPPKVRR